MLSILLGGLAGLSLALALWQGWVALRFPLGRRTRAPRFTPPLTILKPLKGCDAETEGCLRSWLTQDYDGPLQILFGAASADDPVCDLVRSLILKHPGHSAQLVICSAATGTNAKVAQLIQLERLAENDVVCISDADVWVAPDFLAHALAPLQDPAVGLVHCLYRLANTQSWAMRWEAVANNVDFWSQVLQSLSLQPMDFALGAAMFTTRARLASMGGLVALADQLADDYELGHRLAHAGARIVLSTEVVECRSVRLSFLEVWLHQLRWARTIRACRPISAFFTILSNASLWPLLWVGFAPSLLSALGALGCLSFRLWNAVRLERRLTGRATASSWAMPIVKDLLQVLIWGLSFSGNEVTWRGTSYRLEEGGRLTPLFDGETK